MDHYLAVDDDSADIGGASAIHQKVGAVKRLEVGLLLVDEDQIGGRAGRKLPMASA